MGTKGTIITILAILLVLFTLQNAEVVSIQVLFWSIKTSRILVILGTLLIGMAIGWIGCYIWEEKRLR